MNIDKTPHTPFDDMLEPKFGLPRPWKRFRLRRSLSPLSSYGLAFTLGAVFVFMGSAAVRQKLPAPVMPTPLPAPQAAKVSIQTTPVSAPVVYPTPAPQVRQVAATVSQPVQTASPPETVRGISPPPKRLAEALAPVETASRPVRRRVRKSRPAPIAELVSAPRRLETVMAQLPPIRLPRNAPVVRREEQPPASEPRYYPEFDPVRQAQDHRRGDFEDEFNDAPNDEGDEKAVLHSYSRYGEAMDAPGPTDGEFSVDEADDYPGHHWGRAGGRERKWKRERKWEERREQKWERDR